MKPNCLHRDARACGALLFTLIVSSAPALFANGRKSSSDHGTAMKVESTAVTNFQVDPNDANACIITYNVTINGVAGTATVRVADYGEPGRNDTFAITLSNGYTASGDLGGSQSGGGNIQVHKCPPGWD